MTRLATSSFRRLRSKAAFGLAIGAVLLLAACGSARRNELRPPSPINIGVLINDQRISISPRAFGAGPIVLVVTNQSDKSRSVTLETAELRDGRPAVVQQTGPINPLGTGEIRVNVPRGVYRVRTDSDVIAPARIAVGAKRPTTQNTLLQP